jgi:cell division protein FtsB
MMRLLRVFFALYIGIVLNFSFTFFFGAAGLKQYQSILTYKGALEDNLHDLKALNWSLKQEFKSLGTDPERIRLLARSLNFFRPEENVVKIENLPDRKNYYKIGRLIKKTFKKNPGIAFFRVINLVVPVFIYFVTGLFWRPKK